MLIVLAGRQAVLKRLATADETSALARLHARVVSAAVPRKSTLCLLAVALAVAVGLVFGGRQPRLSDLPVVALLALGIALVDVFRVARAGGAVKPPAGRPRARSSPGRRR